MLKSALTNSSKPDWRSCCKCFFYVLNTSFHLFTNRGGLPAMHSLSAVT